MRRIKRILSLFLILTMTCSLLSGVIGSSKVQAADDFVIDLTTGTNTGLKTGYKVEDVLIKKATVGVSMLSVSNFKLVLNNGKYDLDPDDVIETGVDYSATLTFTVSNTSMLAGITSVKINTYASSYDNSLSDYVTGSVSLVDSQVTIKTNIKAYPTLIGIEEIGKLQWELIENAAINTKATILDSANVHYTASAISWYFSTDKGKTRKSIAIANEAADENNRMYIAVLKLTAKSGYCFKEYTATELQAITTSAEKYEYTYPTNKSKREITLTILGLRPTSTVASKDSVITEIQFDTEREIRLTTGLTVSYLKNGPDLPHEIRTKFGINDYLAPSRLNGTWTIYNSQGKKLNDTDTLSTGTYYACYPLGQILSDINYYNNTKYTDDHFLIEAYKNETTPLLVGDNVQKSFRTQNWVVKVTIVNSGEKIRPAVEPRFTFDKVNMKYYVTTDTGNLAATAATGWVGDKKGTTPIVGMSFSATNTTSGNSIVSGGQIYSAWGYGTTTTYSSPVSYRYYNTADATDLNISNKSITFALQYGPKTGDIVYGAFVRKQSASIIGDNELLNAIDYNKKIWSFYTATNGSFDYNNGVAKFAEGSVYMLHMYIPIKDGYNIYGNTCKIQYGGTLIEAAILPESNGKFLHIYGALPMTERVGFINAKSVNKKMYFSDFNSPVANEAVPKKLLLTKSSARFAEFGNIQWLEDGKPFSGSTFTAGKRYEATVILNAGKGYITANVGSAALLVGDTKYVRSAIASAGDQTIRIEYSFGVCPIKSVKKVESISILFESGTTLAAFESKLNEKKTARVTCSDGSTEDVEVKPNYKTGTTQYASFYEQFIAQYPGDKGYKIDSAEEQNFTIYGIIDLSKYNASERYEVKITIKVSEGLVTVTFDANGGTYLGEKTMKVKKNGAYGFGYDPAKIYREGYFFAGWYLDDKDNTDAVNRVWSKSICKGNVTLYAHWLKTFTGICWDVSAKSYSKGTITYKWDNIKTLYNGFETIISTDGKKWSDPEDVGKIKIRTFTDLNSNKNYYLRVRAYRYDSTGLRVYGNWSKVVKVKVK